MPAAFLKLVNDDTPKFLWGSFFWPALVKVYTLGLLSS